MAMSNPELHHSPITQALTLSVGQEWESEELSRKGLTFSQGEGMAK